MIFLPISIDFLCEPYGSPIIVRGFSNQNRRLLLFPLPILAEIQTVILAAVILLLPLLAVIKAVILAVILLLQLPLPILTVIKAVVLAVIL